MKVISKAYLIEGERSYKPGDEITIGQLFDQAVYYQSIGKVMIIDEVKLVAQVESAVETVKPVADVEPAKATKVGRPRKG